MNSAVRMTLGYRQLARYVTQQLNKLFDDGNQIRDDDILELFPETFRRIEYCFIHINNKYFFDGHSAAFSHLHGDQYSMFLYLLGNIAYKLRAPSELSTKLFLLNKALHGIDAFYEVELPAIFLFVHPLGTVLGRGSYSDYFVVYQRCGVGSNHDVYPKLGPFTTLRPGSSVLGNCTLGRNNTLAADSLLLDKDLINDQIYIGNPRSFLVQHSVAILPIWVNHSNT